MDFGFYSKLHLVKKNFFSGAPILFLVLWGALFIVDTPIFAQNKAARISGFVREEGSEEVLAGITVRIDKIGGTITNRYGFFSLSVPIGQEVVLRFSGVGYQNCIQEGNGTRYK